MKIIIVVIIGILIFVFLKALNTLYVYVIRRYKKWTRKLNLIPAVEFISWLIFIFWAIDFLFKNKLYYQYLVISIVIIVVAFLAWFVVKDFIAGIVFKVQNDLHTNSNIQLGAISGVIKSQYLTHIKVETAAGQIVKIPYSRLNHEVISEISDAASNEDFKFQVQIKKIRSKKETESLLNFHILNSPWSNFNKKPVLKLFSEDESHYTFDITASTLNHKHMWLLEKSLKEQLSDI
jgi:hypothetical protein